jgi:hypothetical protein
MSMFGWSLPPGVSTLPGEEPEEPIDLCEDKTLKGYGRRGHGLNGKNADLDAGGQNVVLSAWWFVEGQIEISGQRYAVISPCEEATEEQMGIATEIVCCTSYNGEWDGDYWVMTEDYSLLIQHEWDDDLTVEANTEAALAACYDAIRADSAEFEKVMAELADDVCEQTKGAA